MIYKGTKMSLAKLNEVLFENSDKIPEGLYLELMNLSKGVFEEIPKQKIKTAHYTILYRNYYCKAIRTIKHPIMHPGDEKWIHLVNDKNERIGQFGIGDMIQTLSYGNDKKFYELIKINNCSVRFMEHVFTKNDATHQYTYRSCERLVKNAKKNEQGEYEMIDHIAPPFYCVYDIPTHKAFKNYLDCMQNVEQEED